MKTAENKAFIAVIIISLLCIAAVLSMQPMPQDLAYHAFVDSRTISGIANFYNVISNIPFLLVGVAGLYYLLHNKLTINETIRHIYMTLFGAVGVLAFGSAYYHLSPDNSSLLWDRLPMAIAFMSLFAIVIGEFVSSRLSKKLFLILIAVGIFSVLYWHYTELLGKGDLRLYILTQFLPMILITLILSLYRSSYNKKNFYWMVLAAYVAAKILELFDREIYELTGMISGHSLKHIAAAASILVLIYGFKNREILKHD